MKTALIGLLAAVLGVFGYEATTQMSDAPTTSSSDKDSVGIRIGVVYGPETTDKAAILQRFTADGAPLSRIYYGIRKDFATPAPGDSPTIPLGHRGGHDQSDPQAVVQARYNNFNRFDNLRTAGVTRPLISTESFYGNIHWTWKYPTREEWGGDFARVSEDWVPRFIANMNEVYGVGGWDWQIASEPWNANEPWQKPWERRWRSYAQALLEGYLRVPEEERPRVVYAALPIGQGDAKPDTDGFKKSKWHEFSIAEFVLPEWRPHIFALAFHAYPLTWNSSSNKLEFDRGKIDETIEEGLEAVKVRDALVPEAEVWCTETGAPYGADWAMEYYTRTFGAWDAAGISRAYVYSYQTIDGGEHFTVSYLVDGEGRKHPAYERFVEVSVDSSSMR